MSKNKNTLNWEEFRALGDPKNAPSPEESKPLKGEEHFINKSVIRVHLEKKGRGGKAVSIVKGLQMTDTMMKDLSAKIKSHCGVGGTQKNGEIIIQGDKRDRIIEFLKSKGAKDIKKAGA